MTEREIVLRERAAFVRGLDMDEFSDRRDALARKLYPLPKITRPRVVRDRSGYAWAIFEGKLNHASDPGGNFVETESVCPTPERIKLWADLFARPTEEVEDV